MYVPLCVAYMVLEAQQTGWAKKIYAECMLDLVPGHRGIGVRLLYGDGSLAGVADVERAQWEDLDEEGRIALCDRLARESTKQRLGVGRL